MIDEILKAFDVANVATPETKVIKFTPEIKVKRATDTLYISELKKTRLNTLMATVEVYGGKASDKAAMPLGMLDSVALKTILSRLNPAA